MRRYQQTQACGIDGSLKSWRGHIKSGIRITNEKQRGNTRHHTQSPGQSEPQEQTQSKENEWRTTNTSFGNPLQARPSPPPRPIRSLAL
ncbi:unnamed protein product [Arabis nemorensis]|uniref:Uncharacterized protein n=1 Tax=Arabis nemorensis TaxID=586526 RepID=A0A565C7B3_9BRAS|nr:unnamed protein product [Arabis nemorensis]